MQSLHPSKNFLQWAAVLLVGPAFADTNLIDAGNLNTPEGWDNGLPSSVNPGIISNDGINGTTVFGFDGATVIDQTDGTITSDDGFNFNLGDTWNLAGGQIITRYFLANNSTFNLSGGLVELSEGTTTRHMGAGNGGIFNVSGSVVLDGTQATTDVRTGGIVDIASDWTGSWTWGFYAGPEWRDHFTNNEITLDGVGIDGATFDATFFVTNGGQTLSLVVDTPPTSLIGGDLLVATSWSDGLPVSPGEGTISVDGTLNDDGETGLADWNFTMTDGIITVGQDWHFTAASNIRLRGGTLNVAGNILSGDESVMAFSGGTVTWGGDFEPSGLPGGTITISEGSFTGNHFGNSAGGNLSVSGGEITATTIGLSEGTTTIGGSATLTGNNATFGSLDIEGVWSGSFTVTAFSGSSWETQFTSGQITLAGEMLDAADFAGKFSVSGNGQILTFNPSTDFSGGNIVVAESWNSGLPSAFSPGTIAVDGTLGTTVFGFGGGATINQTAGTLVADDGFNFIQGDTWNLSEGKIIARYILSNGQNGDTIMNIAGGTLELADVDGNQHMGVGNGGTMNISGSAVLDGTQANLEVQTGGILDIASDWTGSWIWGIYSGSEWQDHFLSGSITYDGEIIDEAGFRANFSVSDDGSTLTRFGEAPEVSRIVLNPNRTATLTWNSRPAEGTTYTIRFSRDLSLPIEEWPDDNDRILTGGNSTTYTTVSTFDGRKTFFVVIAN